MNERVRAVLITPRAELLAIRRDRLDTPTYRVLAGGHVEPTDSSLEDALIREIQSPSINIVTIENPIEY